MTSIAAVSFISVGHLNLKDRKVRVNRRTREEK